MTTGRGGNETSEKTSDTDGARGNGDGLSASREAHPTDGCEAAAAVQPGDWCEGQRIAGYRFTNA